MLNILLLFFLQSTLNAHLPSTPVGKTKRRKIPFWLVITAPLSLLAFGGLTARIDSYGRRDHLPASQDAPAEAIVVLGAHVNEQGRPSRSLSERTRHAVQLWKRGVAAHLICTGGIGDNPPSEARAAADLAIALGVPASQVLLEEASTSTRENARFAADICYTHGWKRVVVVSHPYHLWRARRDFERQGLVVYTSAARGGQVDFNFLLRLNWTAREAVLYLRDTLRP